MKTVKVSRVVELISAFLRDRVRLNDVMISGELSNVKYVSGHCYFDLKDEQGQLSCTLWRSYADKAGFRLEDGMAVLVHGTVNVYAKRGSLQLNVDRIELDGIGALYLELEQRKKKLAALGLFDQARKKSRPGEIRSIAIVTGASTAALQDALKTIRLRWPMLRVELFAAPVQGVEAPPKIVKALMEADQAGHDAVLLIRGGGSFEDLFCFNDEGIVRTLAAMKTYTVTGIGHEVDVTLADYAADHRALTPTAAAQWVTPDQREVSSRLSLLQRQLVDRAGFILDNSKQKLLYLLGSSPLSSPEDYVNVRQERLSRNVERLHSSLMQIAQTHRKRLDQLETQVQSEARAYLNLQKSRAQSLETAIYIHSPSGCVQREQARLKGLDEALVRNGSHYEQSRRKDFERLQSLMEALSWTHTLERGFSIVTQNDHVIKDSADLALNVPVAIQFAQGSAHARIQTVKTERKAAPKPKKQKSSIVEDALKQFGETADQNASSDNAADDTSNV